MSNINVLFTNGHQVDVLSVHINMTGDTIFVGENSSYDAYDLFEVKSITPPKQSAPTKLQEQLASKVLPPLGYKWDKQHSTAAAGVILKRESDGDFWFFGMEGEIMHNPDGITIKL